VSSAAPLAVRPTAGPLAPPGRRDLVTFLRTAPTPVRLKVLLYGLWALAALLFGVGELALDGARTAMRKVGKDTAPSIIYAQEISSDLADLDANAGNFLLGNRRHQQEAVEAFEARRKNLSKRLVDAAKNITEEAEREPIEAMFDDLGRYLELVGEARYHKESGDDRGAVTVYGLASEKMHQSLIPASRKLDKANRDALDHAYHEQASRSGMAAVAAGLTGALLAAVLLSAQIFLFRRTRRVFNAPLLGATLIALVYTVYLVTRITVAREDLRVAKEDAFESIHAMWKARAIAYDANGDETRYLLGVRAAEYEQRYRDKVRELISTPQIDEASLARNPLPTSVTGLFADELRNITFRGEREAATRMITAFAEYDRIDVAIRALERGNQHDKAVDLCIGSGENQSNAAFKRFDDALKAVVDLNHREFDTIVDEGTHALAVATYLGPVASILIALLALLGIRPRLREYAA
jgi:hypothetical protein